VASTALRRLTFSVRPIYGQHFGSYKIEIEIETSIFTAKIDRSFISETWNFWMTFFTFFKKCPFKKRSRVFLDLKNVKKHILELWCETSKLTLNFIQFYHDKAEMLNTCVLASKHEANRWCWGCKSTAAISKSQVAKSTKTCSAVRWSQMFCFIVIVGQTCSWAAGFISEWSHGNPVQSRYILVFGDHLCKFLAVFCETLLISAPS